MSAASSEAATASFDFDAFVERELAFCGYLAADPAIALSAAEIETARRGLWEEWRDRSETQIRHWTG